MDGSEVLLLHAEGPAHCPDDVHDLLAGSGTPSALARLWARDGRLYTLRDAAGGPGERPTGVAVVLPVGGGGTTAHLRVVAVRPDLRGQGYGRRLLTSVADAVRREGPRRLVAAAPNGDVGLFALLQKSGFRLAYVERDACRDDAGWPAGRTGGGIVNRDLLWFELAL